MKSLLLSVDKLTTGALALSKYDNKIIFLPGALPGEVLDVTSFESKKDYLYATGYEIIEPSEKRVKPACPYSGICGGCDFDYVDYENSAKLKNEIVKDNLARALKRDDIRFLEPAYSSTTRYRARVKVHISLKDKRVGFLKKRSNSLIEIKSCPLLEKTLDEYIFQSGEFLKRARSFIFQKGVNKKTGYIELMLFNGDEKVAIESDEVVRTVSRYKYNIQANCFFQSNLVLLPELLGFVKENTYGSNIMDLYSGVGTFSTIFEGEGRSVIAVERQKECLRLSKKNAPTALSFTDDVTKFVKKNKNKVDTIIVDPPRVGLDDSTPALLSSFNAPYIIYVSCNSATLARDIAKLTDYRVEKVKLFDFYYGSSHEESVAVLKRC